LKNNKSIAEQRIDYSITGYRAIRIFRNCKIIDINEITIRVALSRARKKTIRDKMLQTHNYGIR
jgi:hypothetical protein